MLAPAPWPALGRVPSPTAESITLHLQEVARRVRGFEAALEGAAEDGLVDLSRLEEAMAAWERAAAPVFVHTALGEGRPLPADLGALARELDRAYEALGSHRATLLGRLGAGASGVVEREARAEIDEALLVVGLGPAGAGSDSEESEAAFFQDVPREALRELPEVDEPPEHLEGEILGAGALLGDDDLDAEPSASGVNRLTGELPVVSVETRVSSPVRADELRLRQQAEAKPLPTPPTLAALLALLPGEWLTAIHRTLQLPAPSGAQSVGSRAAALRGVIHQHLCGPGLAAVLGGMGDREQELLAALARIGGIGYAQVTARWGLDEADGYSWTERPASGTLARVRRAGLAFVGVRGGQRVVVVPADLVPKLPTSAPAR